MRPNVFARIALFVRQVIAELKKVVTPTRSELLTFIAVVVVFVLIVMAYVGVLDFAIGKLVLWAFGA
nr:preprotein translocase subunit SecE [Occultella kanbiaonis]